MTSWFRERRIEWIAESVAIFGYINRRHIEKKFGVSTPQAALDLKDVQARFPNLMVYNRKLKRYEVAAQ